MHYHRSSFKPLRCIIGDAERLGGSTDDKHVAAVLFAMVVIIRGIRNYQHKGIALEGRK